jgi:hypothetical protein
LVTAGCQTAPTPFGQAAGPPASRRQLETLTDLVHAAGHVDLRDARGPLGLTQRQAGGRFTRDEADALIARLEADGERADAAEGGPSEPSDVRPAAGTSRQDARAAGTLHRIPAHLLAAELQRRGWVVLEP